MPCDTCALKKITLEHEVLFEEKLVLWLAIWGKVFPSSPEANESVFEDSHQFTDNLLLYKASCKLARALVLVVQSSDILESNSKLPLAILHKNHIQSLNYYLE